MKLKWFLYPKRSGLTEKVFNYQCAVCIFTWAFIETKLMIVMCEMAARTIHSKWFECKFSDIGMCCWGKKRAMCSKFNKGMKRREKSQRNQINKANQRKYGLVILNIKKSTTTNVGKTHTDYISNIEKLGRTKSERSRELAMIHTHWGPVSFSTGTHGHIHSLRS